MGELEPEVKRGWSYPNVRRDYTRSVLAPAALVLLQVWKARLPERAARMIRAGECEAVMSHFRLVTPRLARAVEEAGGELYVWTVDDARPHQAPGGAGRGGRHHQRPAAVRYRDYLTVQAPRERPSPPLTPVTPERATWVERLAVTQRRNTRLRWITVLPPRFTRTRLMR